MRLLVVLAALSTVNTAMSGQDSTGPEPRKAPRKGAASFAVGPVAKVVTREQAVKAGIKSSWPDTNFGIIKSGANEWTFFAGHGAPPHTAKSVGTLDNPFATSLQLIEIPDDKTPFLSRQRWKPGGGPVYKDPRTGMLLLVYHMEIIQDGPDRPYYSILGMAKSADKGNTWTNLGEIMRHHVPCCPPKGWFETGGAPLTFVNDDGVEYFYVYFHDHQQGGPCNELAVARARVEEVVRNALAGKNTAWFKYHNGSWEEPGIGGRSSPLMGDGRTGEMSVSWNSYLGKFVLVGNEAFPGRSKTETRLFMADSPDGLKWSSRRTLESEPTNNQWYPTIVGLGEDPRDSERQFYVYYSFHDLGLLARRQITLDPDGAPGEFNLLAPAGGAAPIASQPKFGWSDASGKEVTYLLEVSVSRDFTSHVIQVSGLAEREYTVPAPLKGGTTFYWKVTAINGSGKRPANNNDLTFSLR